MLPVHLRQHAMLVRAPLGELGEIVDDALGIGMEDVRAVAVDQHAGFVVMIVGIAADVRPAIDHQHALVQPGRQPLGQHAAGETGPDDQVIETAAPSVAGFTSATGCGLAVLPTYFAHRICSFIRAQV